MTETTQESPVAAFKERVYVRALELGRSNGYERETKVYLEELGLAPTLVFQARDGETVESLNAAVFAKLEELGRHGDISPAYVEQFINDLGLERPGTQEHTVLVTVRLSADEALSLDADNVTVLGRRPVSVQLDEDETE